MNKLVIMICILLGLPIATGAGTNEPTLADLKGTLNDLVFTSSFEAGEGFVDTGRGFNIRAHHPRVITHAVHLEIVIDRMYGANARNPYKRWFDILKASEDTGTDVDMTTLALIYQATGEQIYKDKFVQRMLASTGIVSSAELYGLDIMFDEVGDSVKLNIMDRVAANDDMWFYNSTFSSNSLEDPNWDSHFSGGIASALAYGGVFALTDLELGKDPNLYPFDALGFVSTVSRALAENGRFYARENRIAGDITNNDALPGSPGGMADNFGYDQADQSKTVNITAAFHTLTGIDRYSGFKHDKYRGSFYQNMQYPHLFNEYATDQYCRRGGTESSTVARIWNTQTDYVSQPSGTTVALLASLYQDPRMQYYVNNGWQPELCGAPYNGLIWSLLFYDDTLAEDGPSTNPVATYFNGGGLVTMRSDWSHDAAFGVFIAGEGSGRRYEDANAFLISRKTDVMPHGGARIRNNNDNEKTHWYHIRSISKNTLRIVDPDEGFDINADGTTGALHSGVALVDSDNLGGQIFETSISLADGCFYAPDGNTGDCRNTDVSRSGEAFPGGWYETANVIKYEHVDGDYTYSVGDGAAAYTRKIDLFEREFLFIRPDVFVIFDRVRSVDPNFRKIWVTHIVDKPVIADSPANVGHGMQEYIDTRAIVISDPKNVTYIDTLLPIQNMTTLRGGDTQLIAGATLNAQTAIDGANVLESDIPRWLELFATGDDLLGSVTIQGETGESPNATETVEFDGRVQTYVSRYFTSIAPGQIQDDYQNWPADRWVGHILRLRGGGNERFLITGNNANTIFVSEQFSVAGVWAYEIIKPFANSYQHWKKITSISTGNMDIDDFSISIPHYFDTEDAMGRLHSFSPHSDFRDDSYQKRTDLGQWTVNIEATNPQLLDNFLNVISLVDPGITKPDVVLIQGVGVSGAVIDDYFVVFANEDIDISTASISSVGENLTQGLFLNLVPNTDYYFVSTTSQIELSSTDNGGVRYTSSPMGALKVQL